MMEINSQSKEVLTNGLPAIARKARTALRSLKGIFLYSIHAFWAVPVLIAIRGLRPLVLVRVGAFRFERIGHFAADVGQRKAETIVDRLGRKLDLWYLPDDNKCSNAYWATITRRWLRVHSSVRYLVFWNRFLPFGNIHFLDSSGGYGSRDVYGFLEKAKLRLPITSDEELEAKAWMAQFGWKETDLFVCLSVRDSKYLAKHISQYDWSYHSYRDSDIQTYIRGIEYLVSQGIFVFRMGKDMAQEVDYVHPRFVDYAFRKDKSDLLDVWLFSNCSLCVTTGSGPDMISDVFRRPILMLNFLPLQGAWSWSNALIYPKALKFEHSGRLLSMQEYLDHSYTETSSYKDAGIEVNDLSDYEIVAAVKECIDRHEFISKARFLDGPAQKRFREILMSHRSFRNHHEFIHPEFKLASTFLDYAGVSFLK